MASGKRRIGWGWWAVAGLLVALATIWMLDGRTAVEKIALRLTAPMGLAWIALTVALVLLVRRRREGRLRALGWMTAFSWLVLTLLGNGTIAGWLIRPLEAPYFDVDPFEQEPFDAVVILGGGLSEGVGGRIQLNQAGDRLILGARLYHTGRSPRLYCSGTRIVALSRAGTDPSSQARLLLTQLNVPDEAIIEVGGVNTAAEMRNLAGLLKEGDRVGLITSAWHLPRALRLAEQNGLRVVPVPADFVTGLEQPGWPGVAELVLSLIPGSDGLSTSSLALKEYLAWLVGR